MLLAVPAGGVFNVQSKGLQNAVNLVQAIPLYEKVLHNAKPPLYEEHAVVGSTHPAPLVTHPVRKALQSELVVRVFAA